VFAGANHDCAVLVQRVHLFSVCHFLPDLEYPQYRSCFQVSAVGRGVLKAPKLRKFVGGRAPLQTPLGKFYGAP